MHRNVAAVIVAGRHIGIDVRPREFAESTRTAAEAAAATWPRRRREWSPMWVGTPDR